MLRSCNFAARPLWVPLQTQYPPLLYRERSCCRAPRTDRLNLVCCTHCPVPERWLVNRYHSEQGLSARLQTNGCLLLCERRDCLEEGGKLAMLEGYSHGEGHGPRLRRCLLLVWVLKMLSDVMPDTLVSQLSRHGSSYQVLTVANQFMLRAVPLQSRPCWPDWDLSQDCGFQLLLEWLLYALCQRFPSLEPHSSSSDGLYIDQYGLCYGIS